jgi:sulfide dehydrogenase [flavocytochrome c] flavoprotein subunit
MSKITTSRRALLGAFSFGSAALGAPMLARGAGARVAIVGGGFGGATAAKYLKLADKSLDVTLIERDEVFVTCPFSNYVIGGFGTTMGQITQRYDTLAKRYGVKFVHGEARAIDTARSQIRVGEQRIRYDRLVVAPGVDMNFGAIPGYDAAAAQRIPHAWKAGPQTTLLRKQLEAMPAGGTVILAVPPAPFRCPPGPYERVSTIAWYLKNKKPRAKILVLDSNDAFSKQGLFQAAWESEYPGMITWIAGKDGGKPERVDAKAMSVKTGFGEEKGAVINFIPPQRAGKIAIDSGLADARGWCPVDPMNFSSTRAPNTYVIGDAAIAGAMPKSGSSANAQAKVVAAALLADLAFKPADRPALFNICYSLVTPDYGISVTNVFQASPAGIVAVPNSGGVSARDASRDDRKLEAQFTRGWYRAITQDVWA